jgi:ATP-binding cassette subfamily B protein
VELNDAPAGDARSRRTLRLAYLRPHLPFLAPVVLGIVIESLYYAGLPFSFQYVIDVGLLGNDRRALVLLIAGLASGAVLVALLGFARDYLYARLTARVLSDIRAAMFDHLQTLSLGFFTSNRSGDILARFSTDISTIEKAAATVVSWVVLPGMDVLFSTVLLFALNWKLALISLLVWPLTIAVPGIFARRLVEESAQRNIEEGAILSLLHENLNAQVVVKTFGLAEFARSAFRHRLREVGSRMVRVGWLSGLVERSAYVGVMMLQVALLGLCAWMVQRGELTIGGLTSFQAIFLSMSYSLANAVQYFPTLVQTAASLRRIDQLLAHQPAVQDSGNQPAPAGFDEIAFNAVSFGYKQTRRNLDGLTASIPHGGLVGVVGASGSGKSTLMTLLLRLYDPDEGTITIDGADIRRFPLQGFHSLFGYVPQESILFDVSIRENIRLGKPAATDADVEAAARAAEVHNAILQLPQGYDTPAGERGTRLSGGQRQRIALARALIRNPAILILDEATSALDPIAEAGIRATLERLRHGRTIVSVTHQLTGVVNANRILVLQDGRLCQEGTHADLIDRPGLYRDLWTKQQGFSLDAEAHHAEISIDRLRLVPVFYGLPDSVLAEAVRLFQTEEFPADHLVLREGELGACLYIIVRGSVEVTSSAAGGRSMRFVLQEGDCFGERALLEAMPAMENVRTLSPCVFLTLTQAGFQYLTGQKMALG